jgi:UDP-GlcNAc:undecaprenyl-phosphate/decaprenyl-phosphate GlcNAc-1-phosphate transferase
MLTLLCILVASAGLSLGLTPLARALARRVGLVDKPDGRRKVHDRATPVAGGLAVLASAALAVGAALLSPRVGGSAVQGPFLLGLLLGAVLICAVGVLDDFVGLRGRHKLMGQIAAALTVIAFGVCVRRVMVLGWEVELGLLSVPFTLFWLLGAINALNLIDGMDGLLGSLGLIVSLTLAAVAALAGEWLAAAVAVAMAGALLGFLRYNLPPASIFLGDGGSMVIGLVLGTLAIQGSLKAPTTIVLSAPLVLLTLPLFDTTAALVRRKLTGRSIYTTDRGHLHHCLQRHGLSRPVVLALVVCCCLVTGAGVVVSRAFDNEFIGVVTALSVVGTLIVTRLFGHAEAVLVKERVVGLISSLLRSWRREPACQLQVRLQGTGEWQHLWVRLTDSAERLNLREVRLDVNAPALHEDYHARWDRLGDEGEFSDLWRAQIPVQAHGLDVGRLELAGRRDDEPVWRKIETVSRVVEQFAAEMPLPVAARS